MENIVEVTEKNLDRIIEEHNLVVLDFWAHWCGPCKSFSKVIDEVAPKFPEFAFGKIDIEKEKSLAEEFNIRSIPAVMIIRDKVVVFAQTGALGASSLTELLEKAKAIDPEQLQRDQA